MVIYKKIRLFLCLGVILVALMLFLVNALTYFFAEALVARGYFLENKAWKALLLHERPQAPDFVFVGSSRVQNHINTKYLTDRGYDSFNYGVPGMPIWDYPFVVEQAAKVAGRAVVISIPAESLYGAGVGCPGVWTISDIKFYAGWRRQCLYDGELKDWLQPLAVNILFNIMDDEVFLFPCQDENKKKVLSDFMRSEQVDLCEDSRKLMALRYSRRWVAVFSNGDGVIIPNKLEAWGRQAKVVDKSDVSFNFEVIDFLRELAGIARHYNKEFLILVEASPVVRTLFQEDLEKATGVKVIYLNGMVFEDSEIADHNHVSVAGIDRISKVIYEEFERIY